MPLVNGRILLDRIQEKRVLAGAFNTTNLETTISILNAIERSGLPNFIQIAPTNAQLSGYDYIYEIVKRHADKNGMFRSVFIWITGKPWRMLNRRCARALPRS